MTMNGDELHGLLSQPEDWWMEHALCTEVDPETFFPQKGENATSAKKVCARCYVVEECLERALARQERSGIWGGKTDRERRQILRQRGVDLEAEPEEDETETPPETDQVAA